MDHVFLCPFRDCCSNGPVQYYICLVTSQKGYKRRNQSDLNVKELPDLFIAGPNRHCDVWSWGGKTAPGCIGGGTLLCGTCMPIVTTLNLSELMILPSGALGTTNCIHEGSLNPRELKWLSPSPTLGALFLFSPK